MRMGNAVYPFEILLSDYPDIAEVWAHVERGEEIGLLPVHLRGYAAEVAKVVSSLAETDGGEEYHKLAFSRLYRLTRVFVGLESRAVTEEDMILDDQAVLHLSLLTFGEELWTYLWATRGMITLGEGRREIDHLFNQLRVTRENGIVSLKKLPNIKDMSFHRQRVKRIVKAYFSDFGKAMKVFHEDEIDWAYLRGLTERTLHLARKTLYQANQVPLAYQLKQVARCCEAVLAAIPRAVNDKYRGYERKAYDRMLDELVFLRSEGVRDIAGLY